MFAKQQRCGVHLAQLFVVLVATEASVQAQYQPSGCLSAEEQQLAGLIDDYRQQNGLSPIPLSTVLTLVGQWHLEDWEYATYVTGAFGSCPTTHGWYGIPGAPYVSCCSSPQCGFNKPSEISGGTYTAPGLELAAVGFGSVIEVFNAWTNSPPHNDVLLNVGSYQAMGVAVDPVNLWYFAWFSFDIDPAGPPSPCVTAYCTAGTSASGCQASLLAAGAASATASSGFDLSASGVEGQKDGLYFFGTNGRQANPWGSGTSYQCVIPPVSRGGLLTGSGTIGLCDGLFSQDMNALWCPTCPKPLKNPGAGALVQAQLWYRDPMNTSNQTTSLSDAIEFTVGP